MTIIEVLSETGDWHLAASVEALVHCPFGNHPLRCQWMMHRLQQLQHVAITLAQFNAHCALTARGQGVIYTNTVGNALAKAKSNQPGTGQNYRIVLSLIQLTQASVDVAAQEFYLQVGPAGPQLAFTPKT